MMSFGRCKDLDEWLVGSGESAETADSKRNANAQEKPIVANPEQSKCQGQTESIKNEAQRDAYNYVKEPEIVTQELKDKATDPEKDIDVGAEWMFQTFDHQKKQKATKDAKDGSKRKQMLGLDPFAQINEEEEAADD